MQVLKSVQSCREPAQVSLKASEPSSRCGPSCARPDLEVFAHCLQSLTLSQAYEQLAQIEIPGDETGSTWLAELLGLGPISQSLLREFSLQDLQAC